MDKKAIDRHAEAQAAAFAWHREPTLRGLPLPDFIARRVKQTARLLERSKRKAK